MSGPRWFSSWRDDPGLPEMVAIPPTNLLLPHATLAVAQGFAIGRCAVTFDEMDAYCRAADRPLLDDAQWGRGTLPAVHVSFQDAWNYCAWLTERTGRSYRLPTAPEWELAARCGCAERFWWGIDLEVADANYLDTPDHGTFPVRSLQANPWGLYNVLGNVAEWTDELGSASGHDEPAAALRDGHWASRRDELNLSVREWVPTHTRSNRIGFRVAASL